MAQPNRHNITYLREQLPDISIAENGDALWANLWFGLDERGRRVRIATKKVDSRIYDSAETDYHRDVLDELMDRFAEEWAKALKKAKPDPKPAPKPKEDKEAEGLAKKVAKKITKKKSKA